ncbi:MAG: A24 family peptidase [Acidobacteriia bacterium]|nr:A24 family peptidase [Terriglobia bacterium]
MDLRQTIWVVTLALTLYAGWMDWRTRRIPNWLTVPGFLAGLALNAILGGGQGARLSLEGAGLALGLLLPLVLLRGLGAGDWKLMGAVGALLGGRSMLFVLAVSFLASGLMGIVQIVMTKRVKKTLWNVAALVKGFVTFGIRPNPEISLDNPMLLKQPFGAAVAAATMLSFALAHWRR